MRKSKIAGFVAVLALGANAAQAAIVLSDNFDSYTNGNLSGQGGWTATAAAATPMQVAGGADKYVQINSSGQDEYKAFSASVLHTDGDGLNTAFTINLSAAGATGDYFQHLSDPLGTTSNFYQRVFARSSGAGFQLGLVDTSGTGSTITYGTTVLNFGQSYTVDVVWNFVAGPTNDTFAMTVDSAAYLTHTWTSILAEPAQVSAGNLRQGSAANAPTLQFDNLLIQSVGGGGVTPEPTSLGLLAFAGVAMIRRRRTA